MDCKLVGFVATLRTVHPFIQSCDAASVNWPKVLAKQTTNSQGTTAYKRWSHAGEFNLNYCERTEN
eukprot:294676-Amphidinium_carterae.1